MNDSVLQKIREKSSLLNSEGIKSLNIGYFILKRNEKKYVVALYRIFSISNNDEETYENIYIVYDVDNDILYDEFDGNDNELFSELPEIDSVQFDNNYEDDETIEKAKKEVKEAIEEYLVNNELTEKYFLGLLKIYGLVDKSSKSFYEFFIKEIKNIINK